MKKNRLLCLCLGVWTGLDRNKRLYSVVPFSSCVHNFIHCWWNENENKELKAVLNYLHLHVNEPS